MSGAWLGVAAAAVVGVTGALWFRALRAVRVPLDRTGYLAAMGLGVGLGVAAFATGAGVPGGFAAGFAVLAGGVFLGLRLQSGQDAREPAVKVGAPILDFTAPDDAGNPFDLASLQGKPYLLKFFRGHW